MQSHGGPQLVAELPQCLKKRQDWRGDFKERKPADSPKFVSYELPSRQKGGDKRSLAMIEKLLQFIMDNVVTLENAPASQPSLADRMKAANG